MIIGTPLPQTQPGLSAANQLLLTSNQSNISYSSSTVSVERLETDGVKAGSILYVNGAGDAVWGDPLEMEEERFLNDPFLKDSYEKYRMAKAELTMRIKLQKDAENEK